ncbi:MAG TPA: hypothetical protein PK509_00805 [Catalimonadaceae bacterium]|nr:hypothetical protein [Catalimonadaceae bacterium]
MGKSTCENPLIHKFSYICGSILEKHMSMEMVSYLFFIGLFAATFIVGKWLDNSDKARN